MTLKTTKNQPRPYIFYGMVSDKNNKCRKPGIHFNIISVLH